MFRIQPEGPLLVTAARAAQSLSTSSLLWDSWEASQTMRCPTYVPCPIILFTRAPGPCFVNVGISLPDPSTFSGCLPSAESKFPLCFWKAPSVEILSSSSDASLLLSLVTWHSNRIHRYDLIEFPLLLSRTAEVSPADWTATPLFMVYTNACSSFLHTR